MKTVFGILMMLLSSISFAQIEEYVKYQNQINRAELNLVRGDKFEALNIYYNTLLNYNGNFCKDIYNGLLLSYELSKKDTFFTLLDLLLSKSLSNSYLEEHFESYHDHLEWKAFLVKNKGTSSVNIDLKNKIDSLEIRDQFFRKKEGSYDKYAKEIREIDSENMDYIFSLVSSNNFPGENKIGVSDFKGNQGYDIVFHHWAQSSSVEEDKEKITPIIVNLVLEGKITPNKASQWLEMQNIDYSTGVFDIMRFKIGEEMTDYYIPKYSNQKKILINEYRKWLGMETLEEYYEKFKFKVNNPDAEYIFDISNNVFEVDKKLFEGIISNMVELN